MTNEKPFFKMTLFLVVYDSKMRTGLIIWLHVKECISKEGVLSRPTESDDNSGCSRFDA